MWPGKSIAVDNSGAAPKYLLFHIGDGAHDNGPPRNCGGHNGGDGLPNSTASMAGNSGELHSTKTPDMHLEVRESNFF